MQTPMQTFNRFVDIRRWRQLAVVLLAGMLMLVTTACGAANATAPDLANPTSATPPSEGMYPHKDTTRDTSAADAKADRMIREANQRIQQNNGKSLGEQAEDVGEAAQQAAENIGQSTQRAAENAAENARGLVNEAAKTIDQATSDR